LGQKSAHRSGEISSNHNSKKKKKQNAARKGQKIDSRVEKLNRPVFSVKPLKRRDTTEEDH